MLNQPTTLGRNQTFDRRSVASIFPLERWSLAEQVLDFANANGPPFGELQRASKGIWIGRPDSSMDGKEVTTVQGNIKVVGEQLQNQLPIGAALVAAEH